MKLRECKMGILVQNTGTQEIGMVVGITNNIPTVLSEEQRDPSRAIPLIQWQTGRTFGIHPENMKAL